MTTIERNELISVHIELAEKIARGKGRRVPFVSHDELLSAAYFGLVDAAKRYEPALNDAFGAYAAVRIAGAVSDYLRELSWGPRGSGVRATIYVDEPGDEPLYSDGEDFFKKLTKTIPAVHRKVLREYYLGNKTLQEIAVEMGVNQSRVSQILSDAKNRVRTAWAGDEEEIWAEVA